MRLVVTILVLTRLAIAFANHAQAEMLQPVSLLTSGNSVIALFPDDPSSQLFVTSFSAPQVTSLPPYYGPIYSGNPVVDSPTSPLPGMVAYVDIYYSSAATINGYLGIHVEQRAQGVHGEIAQFASLGGPNYVEHILVPTDRGTATIRIDVQLEVLQDEFNLGYAALVWPVDVEVTDFDFFFPVLNPFQLSVDPDRPLARLTITRVLATVPVPEPSTYALAAIGVVVLLTVNRRKR